jgi:hypothetical protein
LRYRQLKYVDSCIVCIHSARTRRVFVRSGWNLAVGNTRNEARPAASDPGS